MRRTCGRKRRTCPRRLRVRTARSILANAGSIPVGGLMLFINFMIFFVSYYLNLILMGTWWWLYMMDGKEWLLFFVCLHFILYMREPIEEEEE